MTSSPVRLKAPWRVVPSGNCLAVEDATGLRLAYVPFEEAGDSLATGRILTSDDARLVAEGIANLPDILGRIGDGAAEPAAAPARVRVAPEAAADEDETRPRSRWSDGPGPLRSVLKIAIPAAIMAVILLLLLEALTIPATVEVDPANWLGTSRRR
ncbi:MAG: hypothetical protein U1E62_19540 [Alsobacter sp.]